MKLKLRTLTSSNQPRDLCLLLRLLGLSGRDCLLLVPEIQLWRLPDTQVTQELCIATAAACHHSHNEPVWAECPAFFAAEAIRFWPWPGGDTTFHRLAERFANHLCQRPVIARAHPRLQRFRIGSCNHLVFDVGLARSSHEVGDDVKAAATPSELSLAAIRAQKATELQLPCESL